MYVCVTYDFCCSTYDSARASCNAMNVISNPVMKYLFVILSILLLCQATKASTNSEESPLSEGLPVIGVYDNQVSVNHDGQPLHEFHQPIDVPEVKTHLLSLKTNVIGWALFNANLAIEYTFNNHSALCLPVYYGSVDYIVSTVKFRMFTFLPEYRYYSDVDRGIFIGVHAGFAYYNLAIGGSTRIQCHEGNRPAIGAGVTAGFIKHFDNSRRWRVEFALGAGCYRHHYDKFYNAENGKKFGSKIKTALYIDNVSVTINYTFDLTKRHAHR